MTIELINVDAICPPRLRSDAGAMVEELKCFEQQYLDILRRAFEIYARIDEFEALAATALEELAGTGCDKVIAALTGSQALYDAVSRLGDFDELAARKR